MSVFSEGHKRLGYLTAKHWWLAMGDEDCRGKTRQGDGAAG